MHYAVLGTGAVGRTVAAKLVSLGEEAVIGTRDPRDTLARTEIDDYGNVPFAAWLRENPAVRLGTFAEAAAAGEVVVNACAGAVSLAVLTAAGAGNLAGKVLIDIANPLDFSHGQPPSLDPVNTDSLAEQIQARFPDAKVVKALNCMNIAVGVDPSRVPGEHTTFIAGDDAGAKKAVTDLLVAFGWPPAAVIDLGDITAARGTEMVLPLWLRLWGTLGHPDFNIHIAGARRAA
jgi:predicted dinucleotide-binding enzyme